MKYSDVIPSHN